MLHGAATINRNNRVTDDNNHVPPIAAAVAVRHHRDPVQERPSTAAHCTGRPPPTDPYRRSVLTTY